MVGEAKARVGKEMGEPLVVTDHGRPVLQVVPIPHKRPAAELLAEFRARAYGPVRFVGDPNESTIDEWNDSLGDMPLRDGLVETRTQHVGVTS